jgi:hypothetical protein
MSVKVKGLDQALKALEGQGDKAVQAVKDVLADVATGIELKAIQNAPSQFAGLDLNIKQRIDKVVEENGLVWKVGIQAADPEFEIEAWLEFGTGLSAKEILNRPNYTAEIRDLAYQFYRNGQGTIVGRPYLFPAFFSETANIVQEIESEIEKATK